MNAHFTLRCLAAAVLSATLAFPALVSAQETAKIKDHRTNPENYFLQEGDLPSSLKLLPGPPAGGTILFLYDKERHDWGKLQRNTERGARAAEDARVSSSGLAPAYSEAFGVEISEENTPELYKLMQGMREDAGDLGTREAKDYYNRMRPFVFYEEMTCNPEEQEKLSTNGSYPSGHTAIGWAEALVLAEINPERQNEILKRGFDIGESRVICGYHFQSDVDAARLTAAATVARLHADPGFNKQLAKAKAEFRKLKKAGKVAAGTALPTPTE